MMTLTIPSTPTQRSRQNSRERRRFQNDGWTKWEAVQLADELEATREMVKADWECWKKLEERFKQIHGPFFHLIWMKMTKTKLIETKG
jgi:hypothetical protein